MSELSSGWPSHAARARLIAAATIAPALSCLIAYSVAAPEWQSRQLSDYVALVLANTAVVFAPFLMYSSASLVLTLYCPERWVPYFGVRFGVYSGIVLSVHLIVVWFGALGGRHEPDMPILWAVLILGLFAPYLFLGVLRLLRRRSRPFSRTFVKASMAVAVPLLLILCVVAPALLFGLPVAVALLSLPTWSLLAYTRVARIVYRNYGGHAQFRLVEAFWLMTWSGIYMGAWRISVSRALEEYAKLPKAPPRCYLCTAAARGHRCVVGSEPVLLEDGTIIFVNLQMRRLKAAEIVLKTVAPKGHVLLRATYDGLGPLVVRWLKCRIVADMSYLALKPIEWSAMFLLRCFWPDFDRAAQRLYCAHQTCAGGQHEVNQSHFDKTILLQATR